MAPLLTRTPEKAESMYLRQNVPGPARAPRPSAARPPHRRAVTVAAADSGSGSGSGSSSGGAAPADRTKELSASAAGSAFDFDKPETAREAIDFGLVLCKRGEWETALTTFQSAMSLPGTGIKRFRDKPRAPSDGERMAALYNVACCHARLGQAREGLLALSACLEAGYADFNQIEADPDLELLRQDERFAPLMQRFRPKAGFLGLRLPW